MENNHEPDHFEKRFRFGCGFLFGAFVTFLTVLREVASYSGTFWAIVFGGACICGYLAVRYGDDFWTNISKWGWW